MSRGFTLLALFAVAGSQAAPGAAPAPVLPKVKPGQVALSKPDATGLVTMLRPVVTRLHADDPVRIALHWTTEKAPITPYRDTRPFARFATLRTMTFLLTAPDGKTHEVKPQVTLPEGFNDWNAGLYMAPTYLLTLTRTGLSHDSVNQPAQKFEWAGGKVLELDRAGIWKIRVKGTITDGKAAGIPFESAEVVLELGVRDIRSQTELLRSSRDIVARKVPAVADGKVPAFLTEDREGNRLIRFRTWGMKWNNLDYFIEVRPDGTPGKQTQREVFTCVAHGTLIDTERGPRPIEQVREGERVWGYDGSRRVLTTVRLIRTGSASETLLIGGTLRVTADHPIWVEGQWLSASLIGKNSQMLDVRLRKVEAGQPRRIREAIAVYDLTVDLPSCFFAGGYLVHNKDRAYSPKLDDPWYDLWPE